jgi:very-short-patch-repair endonuclease
MAKNKSKPTLEDQFLEQWNKDFPKLPKPLRQYPVKNPKTGRFWKLDFSWPEWRISVEIQGGSFVGGRHNSGAGMARDYEKHNHLVQSGWRCLYFATGNLRDMEESVQVVAEVLCNAREVPNG